jgi:deoxyribodipyrimidine photo-lyase
MKRSIIWFRNDLRTTDHAVLHHLAEAGHAVVAVYIFDERQWQPDPYGLPKTGVHRTQFLLESVRDLDDSLASLGCTLLTAMGNPAAILTDLAKKYNCSTVYATKEHTREEVDHEAEVAAVLPLQLMEGLTLIHPNDLPFDLERLPDVFTQFRNGVEKRSAVRAPLPEPEQLHCLVTERSSFPTLADFGYETAPPDPRQVLAFTGGALPAWDRLDHYFWGTKALSTYKETRNGLLGADYSSKFSPWLANGCISPREIWAEVKRYEAEIGGNESTYWLLFELLWRDYFRFVAMKYGDRIFYRTGIKRQAPRSRNDARTFTAWAEGNTPEPFVNANMKELVATGFMSNRGRQNVASYLVHDLGIDWRCGAAFFEHHLIDYDPASNYGNWIYIAGVGNDPRENRKFNIARQADIYDAKGEYQKTWLT